MEKLYIITSGYPFAPGEKPFLLTELRELSKKYDVTLFSRAQGERDAELPDNVKAVRLGNKTGKIRAAWYTLKAFLSPDFSRETEKIKKSGENVRQKKKACLIHFIIAAQYASQMRAQFRKLGRPDIVYPYWGNAALTGMALTRRRRDKWKLISRCHGFELYTERAQYGYQPFRHVVDRKIDAMYLVCRAGYDYYRLNWSVSEPPVCHLSYIGSSNEYGVQPYEPSDTLRLVSCSNIVELKHIEKIIEAIALSGIEKIKWTHYGTGGLEEKMKALAAEKLSGLDGVTYEFAGYVDNSALKKIYSETTFDCFLTASDSEGGAPVSIAEAMSFGVPVIATAAGGIPELVGSDNGYILPVDAQPEKIAEALRGFASLTEEERLDMRKASRARWESDFCAEENARVFTLALGDVERRR